MTPQTTIERRAPLLAACALLAFGCSSDEASETQALPGPQVPLVSSPHSTVPPSPDKVQGRPAEAAAVEVAPDPLVLEVQRLKARIHELELELARSGEARSKREFEWLEYNKGLAGLDVDELIEKWTVHLPVVEEDPFEPPPEPTPDELQRSRRAEELALSLRNLMRVEEVFSLDLLEHGTLITASPEALALEESGLAGSAQPDADAESYTALGPVVFRLLDDRGRLTGSLNAQRLRLEASRAAFTVTLVLEDGFESRSGVRTPFTDGERRVVLPHVRPDHWYEALPELFEQEQRLEATDDGLWKLTRVQRELNALLREDASGGFYVLKRYAGLRANEFLDVQLVHFDTDGRIERRVFADRMTVVPQVTGAQLVLSGGAVVRGDETTPFLNGTYRIFLPRVSHSAWREARLPGFWSPLGEFEEAGLGAGTEGDAVELPGGSSVEAIAELSAEPAAEPESGGDAN